mgnify:CR=1 FL=1
MKEAVEKATKAGFGFCSSFSVRYDPCSSTVSSSLSSPSRSRIKCMNRSMSRMYTLTGGGASVMRRKQSSGVAVCSMRVELIWSSTAPGMTLPESCAGPGKFCGHTKQRQDQCHRCKTQQTPHTNTPSHNSIYFVRLDEWASIIRPAERDAQLPVLGDRELVFTPRPALLLASHSQRPRRLHVL